MVRIEPDPELQLLPDNIIRVWKHRTDDIRNVEFTIGGKEYKGKIFLVDNDSINVFGTGTYKIIDIDYIGGNINAYIIEQTAS
jgi:hypothetical protein